LRVHGISHEHLSEKDLGDLKNIDQLTCSNSERSELVSFGPRPLLVTAPHSAYLVRDGDQPHRLEFHTAVIAQALSRILGGTLLTWSDAEQLRSKILWMLGRRCSLPDGALLDPKNRDPNFLRTVELDTNVWFQHMLTAARCWQTEFGSTGTILHVDVHGCRDPPQTPSHLTIGLGAMMMQAAEKGEARAEENVQIFGEALEAELGAVLETMKLKPKSKLVRVIPTSGETCGRFSGAWEIGTDRCTQSQQAIALAGFTHSVQLEMSKTLRLAFVNDAVAMTRFGHALRSAWVRAKASMSCRTLFYDHVNTIAVSFESHSMNDSMNLFSQECNQNQTRQEANVMVGSASH